jgi:hypothetical protein
VTCDALLSSQYCGNDHCSNIYYAALQAEDVKIQVGKRFSDDENKDATTSMQELLQVCSLHHRAIYWIIYNLE